MRKESEKGGKGTEGNTGRGEDNTWVGEEEAFRQRLRKEADNA